MCDQFLLGTVKHDTFCSIMVRCVSVWGFQICFQIASAWWLKLARACRKTLRHGLINANRISCNGEEIDLYQLGSRDGKKFSLGLAEGLWRRRILERWFLHWKSRPIGIFWYRSTSRDLGNLMRWLRSLRNEQEGKRPKSLFNFYVLMLDDIWRWELAKTKCFPSTTHSDSGQLEYWTIGVLHRPTSSGASEWANEQTSERCEQTSERCKRTSERVAQYLCHDLKRFWITVRGSYFQRTRTEVPSFFLPVIFSLFFLHDVIIAFFLFRFPITSSLFSTLHQENHEITKPKQFPKSQT